MNTTDSVQFFEMTYGDFLGKIEVLSSEIEAESWRPDYIVGIGRGGLVPGAYLSHRLGIPMLSVDHSSKVHVFADALLIHLALCCKDGEKYLFIDDINDSGKTLLRISSLLTDNGACAKSFRFAVLIGNVASQAPVTYVAETIDRREDKRWFIFPWGALADKDARERDAREVPERLGLSGVGAKAPI